MFAPKYKWLLKIEGLPRMIQEAIKIAQLNTVEVPGAMSNPEILKLANEANVLAIYNSDETPWCAIAHVVVALRAGKPIPFQGYERVRASSFVKFGNEVSVPMLGDTLVFKRPGGYHVGLYVAEDDKCFHVAGGNQGNQFSFCARIEKTRLFYSGRPHYNNMPVSVKRYYLNGLGITSDNEQ